MSAFNSSLWNYRKFPSPLPFSTSSTSFFNFSLLTLPHYILSTFTPSSIILQPFLYTQSLSSTSSDYFCPLSYNALLMSPLPSPTRLFIPPAPLPQLTSHIYLSLPAMPHPCIHLLIALSSSPPIASLLEVCAIASPPPLHHHSSPSILHNALPISIKCFFTRQKGKGEDLRSFFWRRGSK